MMVRLEEILSENDVICQFFWPQIVALDGIEMWKSSQKCYLYLVLFA